MSKPVREYLGPILSILGVVNLALSILNGFRQLLGPHLKWVFMLASVAWAVWLWLERKPALLTGAPRQPFYPKWLRIGGTVAAVLVAVASFVPSARRWWENQRPANKVIVVLARFYDPNAASRPALTVSKKTRDSSQLIRSSVKARTAPMWLSTAGGTRQRSSSGALVTGQTPTGE
jgi:hypothetical protein